jgi:rare lipoprotein A
MTRIRTLFSVLLLISLAIIAGCSSTSKSGKGGGYYKDDGLGSNIPADIEAIPDAVPRLEPHSRANFRPYVVFGKKYFPVSDEAPFRQQGTASWYGRKFHGKKTANGETYDMYEMSAAHPTLPLPSYARVTHAKNGRSVIVRINDRGPFHSSRIIDLSYVAAAKLGLVGPGSGQVIVEAITNSDIKRGVAGAPKATPIPAAKPPEPTPALTVHSPQPKPTLTAHPPTPDALAALGPIRIGSKLPVGSSALPDDADANDSAPAPAMVTPGVDAISSAGGTQVYLQFGAFSSRQTAHQVAEKLNGQIGLTESLQASVESGENLHRVRMGPYPSRTLAVNAALRIQEQTGMQPAVALR